VNFGPDAGSRHRLLLGLLVCVWAVSWPVMKVGVARVPPLWFGCLRYLIGTSFLFVFVAARRALVFPGPRDWPLVLVSGTLQMAAFSALTGLALTSLPPGRTSVLAYSTPLLVVPLAAWRLNEPLSIRALLGVATGLAGMAVIAAPSIHAGRSGEVTGYALIMGAAALWALSIVFVRAHPFVLTPLQLAPWQMLVAALLLLPLACFAEGPFNSIDATGAATLAYVGFVATAFAYWAVVEIGRYLPASTISVTLLATPVLGLLISGIALGERVNSSLIGGTTLIFVGICLCVLGRWRNQRATAPSGL
jgi:drug/metabolite transporter (DMT)-like permease